MLLTLRSLYETAAATTTLVAGQGSYTLTGENAGLLFGRKITTDRGAYALNGNDAGLLLNRLLAAVCGNYTLSGKDAAFIFDRPLLAGQGSYTLTGEDISVLRTYVLAALEGSCTLTGKDADLFRGVIASLAFAVKLYPPTSTAMTFIPGVSGGVNTYPLTATVLDLDTGPETILTVSNSVKTVVTLGTKI